MALRGAVNRTFTSDDDLSTFKWVLPVSAGAVLEVIDNIKITQMFSCKARAIARPFKKLQETT